MKTLTGFSKRTKAYFENNPEKYKLYLENKRKHDLEDLLNKEHEYEHENEHLENLTIKASNSDE